MLFHPLYLPIIKSGVKEEGSGVIIGATKSKNKGMYNGVN